MSWIAVTCLLLAAAEQGFRRGETLALTAQEGTPGNSVALLFDERVTPQVVKEQWHGVSVDGSDNIDSDWTVKGYASTEIVMLDSKGTMLSATPLPHGRPHETRRLARIERVTVAGQSLLMVTVDYSEPLGSYSGDAVFFYQIRNNTLRFVATVLSDGTTRRAFSQMNSAKSGWRLFPSAAHATDILGIESVDILSHHGGTENVFTRVSFENSHWVRHEKHVSPPLFETLAHTDREFERKNFD